MGAVSRERPPHAPMILADYIANEQAYPSALSAPKAIIASTLWWARQEWL